MVTLPHRRKAFQPVVSGGGGPTSTLATNLWAWYEMAETTNTDNAVDASPNGRTWTKQKNMTPDATGAPDGGACRVGTTNAVAMSRSHEDITNGDAVSISFWIRTVAVMGNGTTINFDNNTASYWNLGLNLRGLTVARIYINNISAASLSISLTADTWYHIVLTYNTSSTIATVWINGVKQATTATGTPSTVAAGNFKIQPGAANQKFTGIAVWTKVLSDDEIAELYNGGVNLRYANL